MAITVAGREPTHVGLVLALGEESYYDDSDGYCIVYDESKSFRLAKIMTWTTRFASDCSAVVDATPEVIAKAEEALAQWAVERFTEIDEANAACPNQGKTVVVTRGRKVPKGTVGQIVWEGVDQYRSSRYRTVRRFGLQVGTDRVFVNEDQVEVLDPDQYRRSPEETRESAATWAKCHDWRAPFLRSFHGAIAVGRSIA